MFSRAGGRWLAESSTSRYLSRTPPVAYTEIEQTFVYLAI